MGEVIQLRRALTGTKVLDTRLCKVHTAAQARGQHVAVEIVKLYLKPYHTLEYKNDYGWGWGIGLHSAVIPSLLQLEARVMGNFFEDFEVFARSVLKSTLTEEEKVALKVRHVWCLLLLACSPART